MTPELLAKLEALCKTTVVKRETNSVIKMKTTKDSGVIVYHAQSGKLSAIIPTGMTANKLGSVVAKSLDKLNEFRDDLEQNILKL
jgi:hypothetical protein